MPGSEGCSRHLKLAVPPLVNGVANLRRTTRGDQAVAGRSVFLLDRLDPGGTLSTWDSTPRPPKRRRAGDPPGWLKVLILAFVVFAIALVFVQSQGEDTHSKHVDRAGHPGTWPLTVDSGTLECIDGTKITIKVNGTRYALNGLARSDSSLPDFEPMWADDPSSPGLKMSVGPLIAEGQQLC